ncbi:MAG: Smr/MutS family protein [Spirochaetaceae bacterium]|jgi:DNA-nicking Smr family endonuclease|nr:Smr/MutS family protein [Spirochaetaceae bacterium]
MDFGEILEQWENGSYRIKKKPQKNELCPQSGKALPVPHEEPRTEDRVSSGKKVPSGNPGVSRERHPVDIWLDRCGVTDKDAAQEQWDRQHIAPGKLPVEAHIDLHGLSQVDAWRQLSDFIDMGCRRGFRKVLIIHGKGNHSGDRAVLASLVKEFILRDTRLGASGHPDRRDGGRGATWVIIKTRYFSFDSCYQNKSIVT